MIVRIKDDVSEELLDQVATEVPFSLVVNGHDLVSFHCTPSELDALALGFLISEGIVRQRSDLKAIEVDDEAFAVRVELSCLEKGWERKFQKKTITSGCGYGVSFTDGSRLPSLAAAQKPLVISIEKTRLLLKDFVERSTLFKATGGVHSAALVADEQIILFSEDIGRHNAVDKIIGKAFLQELVLTDKIILSSGRISGEIMTKIIRSRVPVLITRAAPTCMSMSYAEYHGVTLIGFARGSRMNVYTHPQAIKIGA